MQIMFIIYGDLQTKSSAAGGHEVLEKREDFCEFWGEITGSKSFECHFASLELNS